MPSGIPSFPVYSESSMFSRLADINYFRLIAQVPRVLPWSDEKLLSQLTDKMFEQLRDVVKAAKFHYEDELRPVRRSREIGVEYADDRYDFAVLCSEDNIVIQRRGTRLSNFHEWYSALMPSAQGILTNIAAAVSDLTGHKIDIMRARYSFEFIVYDLIAENTNKPVRNSEVMAKLLRGFPDDAGAVTELPAALSSMGRADVAISRWVGVPGHRRVLRYSIEAPANMGWSSLWFKFSYGGESYSAPESNLREAFDPEAFLAEYDTAYVEFLRDKAINRFMEWLLHGYHFKSTASSLP